MARSNESYITRCPRCGSMSFENLETYSHCPGCLYFEDYYYDAEKAFHNANEAEALLDDHNDEAAIFDMPRKNKEQQRKGAA